MNKELPYERWCLTVNSFDDLALPTEEKMVEWLEPIAVHYIFQKEKGEETGRLHYQCAIRFKSRKRKSTLLRSIERLGLATSQFRFTQMNGSWEANVRYCSKVEGRVNYPVANFPVYEGADVEFLSVVSHQYPWQSKLLAEVLLPGLQRFKIADDREILWIKDPQGNNGKSKFVKFMCLHYRNCVKVPFGTATQMRSTIISMGPQECYFIDIPRTLGRDDDMTAVLSVIEDLKNGFVVSSMYGKNAELIMTPPHIILFSNRECPVSALSGDRWSEYEITGKELAPVVNPWEAFN